MTARLSTLHGNIILPAFLPDATRAAVKSVDSADLEACGINAIVVNVFHLLSKPGVRILSWTGRSGAASRIHGFMGWNRPIVSDSGGFQIFSMLSKGSKLGRVTSRGFTYRMRRSGKKISLTPVKSIDQQMRLGADILICLDQCMHPDAPAEEHRESVDNTINWAKECKAEFLSRIGPERMDGPRPLLFAVIQGGEDFDLRRICAERLIEIGFDGYCFGGWPLNDRNELVEAVEFTAKLMPDDLPKFALGICGPEHIVRSVGMGYTLFDGALPTRDARRQRLYIFNGKPDVRRLQMGDFCAKAYIENEKYADDHRPVDETCDCLCCSRYSRSYLHHLFNTEDPLALRLATIHNLRFWMRLMETLQGEKTEAAHGAETPISWASNAATLVEELGKSRKYGNLCDDTIGRIAEWALKRSENEIEAAKKAKRKLHQVYAAFLESFDYDLAKRLVESIGPGTHDDELKSICREILSSHQSTSERLPIIDKIYPSVFEITGKPASIVDIACGLNPFSIPWMGIDRTTKYVAMDIDKRMAELLNRFFEAVGINGEAQCRDAIVRPPEEHFDLALLLKTIPSLERQEKGSSRRLIEGVNAKNILVSFPTSSIGGYEKGMSDYYESELSSVIEGLGFSVRKIEFAEEVFYVLSR